MPENSSDRIASRGHSLLGFIILGAFAVPFLLLPGYWFYRPLWYEHRVQWVEAQGNVEEARIVESKMRAMSYGYELHADYRYSVGETEYYSDRVGFAPVYKVATTKQGEELIEAWEHGHSVTVYVDANDPNRAVLIQDTAGRMWPMPAVAFSLIGLLLALCAVFTLLRPLLPTRLGGLP
jgi:hypothetical protein